MLKIGQYADLEVIKKVDFGLYLDGGPYGEVLLPNQYIPEGTELGQDLRVFIYCDSEDRIIATTMKPLAIAGDIACLKVRDVNDYGAFLDWGLPKDLFVPFREQVQTMKIGQTYVVKVYLDQKTDRLLASARLNRFIKAIPEGLSEGDKVNLMLAEKTPQGYKAIINGKFWGMLYDNEIFGELQIGEQKPAFVKKLREDGKVDLSLQAQGYRKQIPAAAKSLLEQIKMKNGFLPLTDKSPPEQIYQQLKMSKKAFKKAVGMLYKQRLIRLEDRGIRLIDI